MPKDIEFILKDFVRHVINLKAEDDPAGTGFHREFRILREEQMENKNENRFSTEDGRREENLKKNRYKDILPRDDKRVKLTEIEGEKGSDYINSSFIEDVDGQNGYIAAQGPMPHTVTDFWRMLWQYNTEIVFMACRVKEDHRPKCEKYWPDEGNSGVYGDFTVYTESEEEIQDHFFKRELRVEREGETHTLTQFHYVGWPDHNTPSSPDALRTIIEDVRNHRKHHNIPMVVHCSAGCGRTGTICAIDYAWTLLDRGMIKEEFSMFDIIRSMREQRMSMVQTPDQYEYTHMVIKSLCNEWLAAFSRHDYENVFIGKPPEEEEEGEMDDVYANVEYGHDDSDVEATETVEEKVVTIRDAPKQVEKLVTNSQPASSDDVVVVKLGKSEPKPDPAIKPHIDDAVPSYSAPPPPAMKMVADDKDAGEYVEVKPSSVAPVASPRKNANEDSKKRSVSTSSSDSTSSHKTVIVVGGNNTMPRVIQTGSVGASHIKPHTAKLPAQAVVRPMVMSENKSQEGRHQSMADTGVYSDVKKVQPAAKRPEAEPKSSVKPANENNNKDAGEGAPVLPSRNYKPEEISSGPNSPTSPSTASFTPNNINSSSSPPSQPQPQSPKDLRDRPPQPQSSTDPRDRPPQPQPQSLTDPRDRPPQPLPAKKHQPPASPGPEKGVQGVGVGVRVGPPRPSGPAPAKPVGHVVNARPVDPNARMMGVVGTARTMGHQAHPTRSGGGGVAGVVSAMGGGPQPRTMPPNLVRRGSDKSDTRSTGYTTQPLIAHNKGAAPRHPGQVQHGYPPHSAGMRGHPAAPAGTQVIVSKIGGKKHVFMDRPQRVAGPRNMPEDWPAPGRKHSGGVTYL